LVPPLDSFWVTGRAFASNVMSTCSAVLNAAQSVSDCELTVPISRRVSSPLV